MNVRAATGEPATAAYHSVAGLYRVRPGSGLTLISRSRDDRSQLDGGLAHRSTRLLTILFRALWGGVAAVGLVVLLGLAACSKGQQIEGYNAPSVFESLVNAEQQTPEEGDNGDLGAGPAWYDPDPVYQQYPGNDQTANSEPNRRGVAAVSDGDTLNFDGDGYTLNFDNASLPELTKIILKNTLQIPYVYDPRVEGTVTLSSGRALSREELLSALESVLQMNRGALVQEGDRYRIIPLGEARKGGVGDVSYSEEARKVGPGYGITIFPLRHVSSETMLRMLKSFVTKPGALRAEVRNNVLLIRGTGQERNTLVDVARQFDLDWMRGQSVGIYPLKHASPREMIAELKGIFQTEITGLGKNLIRFQPMERLNAVLVITRRSDLLRKAQRWVQRLDQVNDNEVQTFVYRVENSKAQHLAKVLNDTFGDQPVGRRSAADEIAPGQPIAEINGGLDIVTEAQLSNDTSGDVTSAAAFNTGSGTSRSGASGQVRIIPDIVNNKLIIQASSRVYRDILNVLRRLDRAPLQVLISATLAEVTLNDNLRYGVQVFLQDNSKHNPGSVGFTNGDNSLTISPQFPGLNFLYGFQTSPKVLLDALASETSVRVVSSPSVVVLNNQSATLLVGDEVPIATRAATSVTDPEAPIVNDIEFRNTGVILKVTPRINSDDLVTMEIEQEISKVATTTAAGNAVTLTPTISQRRITSTIAVQSGQMVVLGGLISEAKDYTKNRVPIWEKIPILGAFPGKTDNRSIRTELVMFLMPYVIHDSKEAGMITDELRERLRALTPNRRRKYERWPRRKWETITRSSDHATDFKHRPRDTH